VTINHFYLPINNVIVHIGQNYWVSFVQFYVTFLLMIIVNSPWSWNFVMIIFQNYHDHERKPSWSWCETEISESCDENLIFQYQNQLYIKAKFWFSTPSFLFWTMITKLKMFSLPVYDHFCPLRLLPWPAVLPGAERELKIITLFFGN
jgi:hypothetical protein